jgi:hypothetical protein
MAGALRKRTQANAKKDYNVNRLRGARGHGRGKEKADQMASAKPGQWYLVVDCAGCGEPIPVAEIASPNDQPPLQHRTINLACPECGRVDTYAPALMSRRRAEPKT